MEIGFSALPTSYSMDIATVAKRAEELGFESLWVPEHPILPVDTSSPWPGSPNGVIPKVYADIVDPFVALARASAVTTTLKLGTGICLVPEHNPLLLAKEVATQNICVNAVTPTVIRTPMLDQLTADQVEYMTSRIPRGRVLEYGQYATFYTGTNVPLIIQTAAMKSYTFTS